MSEVLAIFAWAAAAFATLYFGPWLIPLMRDVIATPWLASLAAYAGIFLVVLIPLSFIGHRFSETVKHSPIGPLDRALGIAFGVVRGLVIVGLAYLAFTYFVPIKRAAHRADRGPQPAFDPILRRSAVIPGAGAGLRRFCRHAAQKRRRPS